MSKKRRTILAVGKVLLSVALLWFLLRGGMWDRVVGVTKQNFVLLPFVLGLAAFALSNVLGGVQWHILLRAQGIPIGYARAIRLYFVGLFFSNFLPANIGGDVVKVVDVYRSTGKGGGAVAATMMDRAIGLAILALLASIAGVSGYVLLGPETFPKRFLILLVFFLFFIMAILMILSRRIGAFLIRLIDRIPFQWVREKSRSVVSAVLQFRENRGALGRALLVALPVQTLRILVHYAAARTIGVDADPIFFFLFIPIIAVFIALPISINGIGVREGLGVLLYGKIGIPQPEAISISFLAYVIGVAVSLAGGVLFLVRGAPATSAKGVTPVLRGRSESR